MKEDFEELTLVVSVDTQSVEAEETGNVPAALLEGKTPCQECWQLFETHADLRKHRIEVHTRNKIRALLQS